MQELFDPSNSRAGINIGNRSLLEIPNPGNARIFSGASEAEIKNYFLELTGLENMPNPRAVPGKGEIYVIKTPKGSFNLRNSSSSSAQTGPAWTIDIPKSASATTYNPEIKFLINHP
ncbi:hypothetical protein WMO32_21865 [Xanthomonas oryzae pv. oryzicola]|uniref:hypothetical protein n=1 Tax=Xanthomonas oryzae TaxID=347 RepID=UPI003132FEC5